MDNLDDVVIDPVNSPLPIAPAMPTNPTATATAMPPTWVPINIDPQPYIPQWQPIPLADAPMPQTWTFSRIEQTPRYPWVGTPVIFRHNGVDKPGVIQTVWSDVTVNIRVFEFEPHADWVATSIPYDAATREYSWRYVY